MSEPLVWIDCEMTGLDPAVDVLVEVAVIVNVGLLNVVVLLFCGTTVVLSGIALVGAGGRGSGAADNALSSKGGPTKLVAIADVFQDKLNRSYEGLKRKCGDKVDVSEALRLNHGTNSARSVR